MYSLSFVYLIVLVPTTRRQTVGWSPRLVSCFFSGVIMLAFVSFSLCFVIVALAVPAIGEEGVREPRHGGQRGEEQR